jgi:hypothetical protein
MHPRNDYATFELCPTSLGASRAVRTAAGANDDVSAGADAVVPILLGRTGQQAPVVGGAAQEHVHQVQRHVVDESGLLLLKRARTCRYHRSLGMNRTRKEQKGGSG